VDVTAHHCTLTSSPTRRSSDLSRPLKKLDQIEKRLEAVNDFYNNKKERESILEELKSIADLERLLSKVSTGKAVPRDILQLKISLQQINIVRDKLRVFSSKSISALKDNLIDLPELIAEIGEAVNQNFINGSDTYGVINKGYHKDLDELKDIMINGKT